ncbi:MAG: hypothetical protein QM802_04710 [Agriterribacter sp.]
MTKFIVALLLLVSCANKTTPVKNSISPINLYPTSKSMDDAWNGALAFFKEKNIEIQYANKNDGYILTAPVKVSWLMNNNSIGTLQNEAEVIIVKNGNTIQGKNKIVTARCKVKISQSDGKTVLSPSLEDIKVSGETFKAGITAETAKGNNEVCKSTGNFEKRLVSFVN